MQITGIETYLVGNPWKNWLFVRVNTDEGIHGIGEGSLGNLSKTVETAIHEVEHLVLGLDVFQTELLVNRLTRHVYADGGQIKMCAISALEIACWDAIGKALQKPIYQLVGGGVRESIPAYLNGWYRCERTPEAFAEIARQIVERGYTALKFDPFGPAMDRISPYEEDRSLAIVSAVREAVGPHTHMIVEAHSRFTPAAAIHIGRRLEAFNPAWFEEPVQHTNIASIAEVAKHIPVPVGAGESLSSKQQLAELLSHHQINIINFEPLHMGGILGSRKAADMVDAYYGTVVPHAAQGPVCTLACLHIDAATPNAWLQETFEDFNVPWEKDLLTAFPKLRNGYFELPSGPGLGADLNLDEVRRHPYIEHGDVTLFEKEWQFRRSEKN